MTQATYKMFSTLIWSLSLEIRINTDLHVEQWEKGRNLTQSYDKSP